MSNFFDDDTFDRCTPADTIEHVLTHIKCGSDHDVVLILAPANQRNPDYHNARLKIDAELAALGTLTNHTIRPHLIPLFADFVIKGWRHVYGRDKSAVPCIPAACLEFLQRLAAKNWDKVDGMIISAANTDGFRAARAEALGNG